MSTFVNKQRAAGGSTFFNNLRPAARLFGTCSIMIGGCWVRRPLAGLRSSFGVQPAAASQHAGFMFFHYPEHRPRAAPSFFLWLSICSFSPPQAAAREGRPAIFGRAQGALQPQAAASQNFANRARKNPARGAVLIFCDFPFLPAPPSRARARTVLARFLFVRSLFALCSRAHARADCARNSIVYAAFPPLSRRPAHGLEA